MDTLKHHLRLVRPAEEAQSARLESAMNGQPLSAWLKTEYPRLASGIPEDITTKDFSGVHGLAPHAEARLVECDDCPSHGGRCVERIENDSLFRQGRRPYWDDAIQQISDRKCDKWDDYLLYRQLLLSGVRDRQATMRFSNYEPKHRSQRNGLEVAKAYASAFDRRRTKTGLLFASETPGVGKTHLAASIIAELLRTGKIRRAQFEFVPEFLEKIRRGFDNPDEYGFVVDRAKRAELLVLDDLGAHRTNEWVREQLLILTNERWASGLPTLVTQNGNADECNATLGERAYSRLVSDLRGVPLKGPDGRMR